MPIIIIEVHCLACNVRTKDKMAFIVSQDDIMVEETQQQDSPATFSRSLLLILGISHAKPEAEAATNNNNTAVP